jgi:hypothetical protein
MTRTRSMFLSLVILATLLTSCATVVCDPDAPQFGKDCYECTRKATVKARQGDPDTGIQLSTKERIKDRTEECLRERGYMKQKQEGRP